MLSSPTKQRQDFVKRTLRAIIYCRVSTDKQEQDGESLEYQEDKCRKYAELHGIEVIMVLHEVKSGFIHYSHREKLTLARQMIRDGLADMIIVWDLRRFSRNFVHSAMIFEEIESIGAQIVSVSENIDNSLTGKLIRSILAWSAESEREKIVEYANRHWQTRLENNLPIGTGRAPYGWQWKDKDKTCYVINKEEAAIRISIFEMFVELDMSLRSIAHKLTEDGILPPAKSRGAKVKSIAWNPSTVLKLLTDVENIGILRICKSTKAMTDKGTETRKPNPNMKTIPGGIPQIVDVHIYELALMKLKNNKRDKSHLHKNPEDFLLKGHIFCKTCNYRMHGRYQTSKKIHTYPYYICMNHRNKYNACPDLPTIRTNKVHQIVWEDCCRVFERLDIIRETIESNIEQSLQNMLEDTKGKMLIDQLEEEIAFAKQEREKHPEESYYYQLISRDIQGKEELLQRYREEYKESLDIMKLSNVYQKSILSFLNFLNTMRGKYREATFQEKRNALDVLGVKVYIHRYEALEAVTIDTEQEWFTVSEAVKITGIIERTLRSHIEAGHLVAHKKPSTVIHRDELIQFLHRRRPDINLDTYQDEWFTVSKISTITGMGYNTIRRAIRAGELKTQEAAVSHHVIHRDELNRFLRETPLRLRKGRENIEPRIEITYTPIFTGVQSPLG